MYVCVFMDSNNTIAVLEMCHRLLADRPDLVRSVERLTSGSESPELEMANVISTSS